MDLDPESQRILELAREARTPSSADKLRVEKQLAIALGIGVVASASSASSSAQAPSSGAQAASATASATKTAGSALAIKGAIASAVVVTAIAGYVALRPTDARPMQMPAKVTHAAMTDPAVNAPAPIQPTTEAGTNVAEAEPLQKPSTERVKLTPTERSRHASTHRATTTDADNVLGDELELLHRAQAAWRARDAQSALALTAQHRKRFPRSDLKLERDGLQVLALCELNRKSEALPLARALLARAPHAPLRSAIEESCGLK